MFLSLICAPVSRCLHCSQNQPSAASGSLGEKHYSDHPLDDDGDIGGFDDYDIANRHDCNTELEKRPKVKQFFKDAREHESLADPKTRSWLGSLPHDMREEAIPLFVDREVAYPLHPSYTWLELWSVRYAAPRRPFSPLYQRRNIRRPKHGHGYWSPFC